MPSVSSLFSTGGFVFFGELGQEEIADTRN